MFSLGLLSRLVVQLSQQISKPWALIGDLNDTESADEAFPQNSSFRSDNHLTRGLHDCSLDSIDGVGSKYTWVWKVRGHVILRKRLDRAATNVAFHDTFTSGKLLVLDRLHSDHHPLMLLTDDIIMPRPREKPKRFLAAWLYREVFPTIFQNAWQKSPLNIVQSVDNLVADCNECNRTRFGDICYRKKTLLHRISGMQCSLDYGSSTFLQSELLGEYQTALRDEQLLMFQKSRVKWIANGDRNTLFYHAAVLIRRNRNWIASLRINGVWEMNELVLKRHIRDFYIILFLLIPKQVMLAFLRRFSLGS